MRRQEMPEKSTTRGIAQFPCDSTDFL